MGRVEFSSSDDEVTVHPFVSVSAEYIAEELEAADATGRRAESSA
jgi:hypothetical protein